MLLYRATLVGVFSLISQQTHAMLDKFFYTYVLETYTADPSNKENKVMARVRYLEDNPNADSMFRLNRVQISVLEILLSYDNDKMGIKVKL